MNIRIIQFVLAGLFLLPSAGLKAEETEVDQKEIKGTTIKLLASAVPQAGLRVRVKSGETISDDIEVPTHGLSDPIPISTREIVIGRGGHGEEPLKAISKISLPAGKEFLIILHPSKAKWLTRVVRLDDARFGATKVCFVNLTNQNIGCQLGDKKFALRDDELKIVSTPAEGDQPFYQVSFFRKKDDRVRLFGDTRWPHDPKIRSVVFFHTKPGGKVGYRAIDEVLPDA